MSAIGTVRGRWAIVTNRKNIESGAKGEGFKQRFQQQLLVFER